MFDLDKEPKGGVPLFYVPEICFIKIYSVSGRDFWQRLKVNCKF